MQERGLPNKYYKYADQFNKKQANKLSTITNTTLSIKLIGGKEPPYRPLYALLELEIDILKDYL